MKYSKKNLQRKSNVELFILYRKICYKKFHTGFTFKEIRRLLLKEQRVKKEYNDYMFVTRKTVLGRWHQIKLEMFKINHPEFFDENLEFTKNEIIDFILNSTQNYGVFNYDRSDFIF